MLSNRSRLREGGREDSAMMEKQQLVREDNPRSLGFTFKV